jgi:callose synthase
MKVSFSHDFNTLRFIHLSSNCRQQRLYTGILSAVFSGFLVFTYLEPLFVPVGSEPAMVFLYILCANGALVGMSLGVLLPVLFPGVCLGGALALLVAALLDMQTAYFFPAVGGVLAVLSAVLSARYVPTKCCLVVYVMSMCTIINACMNEKRTTQISSPPNISLFRCPRRWSSSIVLTLATILEAGAIAACLVLKTMMPYLMDVARGYPSYPNADDFEVSSFTREIIFSAVWIASSCLVAATCVYQDGHFQNLNLVGMFRRGYSSIPTNDMDGAVPKRKAAMRPPHRDPPTALHDSFNMFDPANLPPRLAEYANMVYSACEDLGNFFGFQDSSVRNQAEHLLILLSNNRRYMSSHILPPSVQPPSPIHALHAKVFSNYVKWCRAMGVAPHFSKMNSSMNAPPAVASRVVDLVLYFCVWGEGANLRHMPECVWFLYHKMMEEYIQSEGYTQTRSLYAGHFLDYVIFPIYNIVAKVRYSLLLLVLLLL